MTVRFWDSRRFVQPPRPAFARRGGKEAAAADAKTPPTSYERAAQITETIVDVRVSTVTYAWSDVVPHDDDHWDMWNCNMDVHYEEEQLETPTEVTLTPK